MSVINFTMTDIDMMVEMGIIYPHLSDMYARDIDKMIETLPQETQNLVRQTTSLYEKAEIIRAYLRLDKS